jgi:hypothetical protein
MFGNRLTMVTSNRYDFGAKIPVPINLYQSDVPIEFSLYVFTINIALVFLLPRCSAGSPSVPRYEI